MTWTPRECIDYVTYVETVDEVEEGSVKDWAGGGEGTAGFWVGHLRGSDEDDEAGRTGDGTGGGTGGGHGRAWEGREGKGGESGDAAMREGGARRKEGASSLTCA